MAREAIDAQAPLRALRLALLALALRAAVG